MPVSDNPKKDAVNIMLASIGEQPVNSLNSGLVDAEMAETILDAQTREVQGVGWHFNTDFNKKFVPDSVSGEIKLPLDTLNVDAVGQSKYTRLVQRGDRLYDPINHTYDIGSKYSEIYLDIVIELDFNKNNESKDSLPNYARRYITVKAARIFQSRVVGSEQLHGFTREDELEALFEMKRKDAINEDISIFNNYDVYRVIHRGYPNLGSGSLRYASIV